ncbi:hypothetical protein [Diplocloster modestus]|uniref:Uncharacterized protein n=1 Tax=Diplocloster modestus TaxID=2850322 RepID=A0ABS6KCZ6_9FIRM|nr:hypothetical protein [Diplocloster modestus]MBU9728390.1 hypothetical protein [Diplocloster modestus]
MRNKKGEADRKNNRIKVCNIYFLSIIYKGKIGIKCFRYVNLIKNGKKAGNECTSRWFGGKKVIQNF